MPRKKIDDNQIVALNNVGLSLCSIGERFDIHHTTVKHRLKALGFKPADTRRAFMEDIFERLSSQQQKWLIDQLGPGYSIKDFVRTLLLKEFINRSTKASTF